MKVMFIDDDSDIAEMMSSAIKGKYGYDTYFETNPFKALKEVDLIHPDLIFTDIKMPFLDGISLCRKIKDKTPEIPVILLSAFNPKDSEMKYSGADAFLEKPLTINEINQSIIEHVRAS